MQSTATPVNHLQDLATSISELSLPINHTKIDNNSRFHGTNFLTSNDNIKMHVIEKITEMANKGKEEKATNIGILVGETNIFSLAPELSKFLDVIIFFDINPIFHLYMQGMIQIINESNNREEFITQYVLMRDKLFGTNHWLATYTASTVHFQDQIDRIGSNCFFLSSEKRFLECKESINKIKIIHYREDFLNETSVKKLSDVINKPNQTPKNTLHLINITNLLEYDEKNVLQKSLDALPLASACIMHSFPYPGILTSCMAYIAPTPHVDVMKKQKENAIADTNIAVDDAFNLSKGKIDFMVFLTTYQLKFLEMISSTIRKIPQISKKNIFTTPTQAAPPVATTHSTAADAKHKDNPTSTPTNTK